MWCVVCGVCCVSLISLHLASVWRVLCCSVLCCCEVLYVVVLCVWCVCCVLGEEGGGVYASSTSPCVRSKRPPCVPAPRPHVSYMWTWCTHGGVLKLHTEVFSVPRHTHHTPHTTHNAQHTTHNTHHRTNIQIYKFFLHEASNSPTNERAKVFALWHSG